MNSDLQTLCGMGIVIGVFIFTVVCGVLSEKLYHRCKWGPPFEFPKRRSVTPNPRFTSYKTMSTPPLITKDPVLKQPSSPPAYHDIVNLPV
uniref:Uncharacterized protein n=1 Tax=Abalone asfa-like virus TaxID=2839893 RepID=A0A5K7XYH3_9VIRU|nr:hypothetical protein [Abalone asfa-like virus]